MILKKLSNQNWQPGGENFQVLFTINIMNKMAKILILFFNTISSKFSYATRTKLGFKNTIGN